APTFHRPLCSTLFPYTTLFRSHHRDPAQFTAVADDRRAREAERRLADQQHHGLLTGGVKLGAPAVRGPRSREAACIDREQGGERSEEHTSELQSRENLVCRLLL